MISVTYSTGSSAAFLALGDQTLDAGGQFPSTFSASFPPSAALSTPSATVEGASPVFLPTDAIADALDLAKSLQPSPELVAVRYADPATIQVRPEPQTALPASRIALPSAAPAAQPEGSVRSALVVQTPAPTGARDTQVLPDTAHARYQPTSQIVAPEVESVERTAPDQAAPLEAPFLRARAFRHTGVELAQPALRSVVPAAANPVTIVNDQPVDPALPQAANVPVAVKLSAVPSALPTAEPLAPRPAREEPVDDSRLVQTSAETNRNVSVSPQPLRYIVHTTRLEPDAPIVNLTASVTLPDPSPKATKQAEKTGPQGDTSVTDAELPVAATVDPTSLLPGVPAPLQSVAAPVDVPVSAPTTGPVSTLAGAPVAPRRSTVAQAPQPLVTNDAPVPSDDTRPQASVAPAADQPASPVATAPREATPAVPGDRAQSSQLVRNPGLPLSGARTDDEPSAPTTEPKPVAQVAVASIVRPADHDAKNSPAFSRRPPVSDRPEPTVREVTPAPVFNQRLSVVERPAQSDPVISEATPPTDARQPSGGSLSSLQVSGAPVPLPTVSVAVPPAVSGLAVLQEANRIARPDPVAGKSADAVATRFEVTGRLPTQTAVAAPTTDTPQISSTDERVDEQLFTEVEESTQPISFGRDTGTGPQRAEQSAGVLLTGAQPSGAERHLDLARQEIWLDQLAKDIVAARQDNSRLSFRLSPENLGRLDVDLVRSDAGLSVNMTASTAEASAAISSAQPRLVEELRAQGTRVVDTQVRTSDASSTGSNPQSQRNGQNTEYAPFLRTAGANASPDQRGENTRDSDRFA